MSSLVQRISPVKRFVHWVHMVSFLVLAMTGLGLYARSFFGITGLFGGVDMSRAIHHYTGVVFMVTTFAVFYQWFGDITARGEDSFKDVVRSYLGKGPQANSGKFNAVQKAFAWTAFSCGLVISLTGFALWFPFVLARGLQQWMYFLHNFTFVLFMICMIGHVYLNTIGCPGTWRAMTRGTVTRVWARRNHPGWDIENL